MSEVRPGLTTIVKICLVLLVGRGGEAATGTEPPLTSDLPLALSAAGVFADLNSLLPAPDFIEYDINVPFWSDGAEKRRWIRLPPGAKIEFSRNGEWRFPTGTLFIKHFAIPDPQSGELRRIETRVLICRDDGSVEGACYRWRSDNSEANLVPESLAVPGAGVQGNAWFYPGPRDCKVCHTSVAGGVLGISTRQMNRTFGPDEENQLIAWQKAEMFSPAADLGQVDHLPRLAPAHDNSRGVSDRARSFLDANCAYCHRPGGVAGNFDARFETPLGLQNLLNGPLLINLGIDHAKVIAPADVWRSVALERIETLEGTRMPPIGHLAIDRGGAALLREWIQSLPGPVVLAPPEITPKTGEYHSTVNVALSHPDPAAVIHYTLDGSLPLKSSAIYICPVQLSDPSTLRARAFKEGAMQSIAVQETYMIRPANVAPAAPAKAEARH